MLSHASKFGIYFNSNEVKVVRITSPYWFPEAPDWVFLTDEVNATLLHLRELVKEKSLSNEPDSVTWGRIPLKD